MKSTFSRRGFLFGAAAFPFLAPLRLRSEQVLHRQTIKNLRCMVLSGERTYIFVKITASDGTYGIGEAYGSPSVGTKEQILELKPFLVGKDPLGIDAIYSELGRGANSLSGTRTDGSAHNLARAASGIEMALWDLAGKILAVPVTMLLGGRFRDKVRVYDHAAPKNFLDKESCREWAQKVKSDSSGFTAHKIDVHHGPPPADNSRDVSKRVLTTKELMDVGKGFENCREAIGWDHDIMVHCHWEYDLRTSIQLAEAVEPIRPLWLADPMPPDYAESWRRLVASARVPICTGENLARRQGFKDFIVNQGCDILHPDLRNTGGFLETKRIADFAHIYGLPMATHNPGSQVYTYAAAQWAASIRDYLTLETLTGEGGWMDQVLLFDGPYIKDGFIQVTSKPGLGITLNPDVVRAHLAAGETWWG